jgi:hypothetical protein
VAAKPKPPRWLEAVRLRPRGFRRDQTSRERLPGLPGRSSPQAKSGVPNGTRSDVWRRFDQDRLAGGAVERAAWCRDKHSAHLRPPTADVGTNSDNQSAAAAFDRPVDLPRTFGSNPGAALAMPR